MKAVVNTKELLSVLKASLIIAKNQKGGLVCCRLEFGGKDLIVSASDCCVYFKATLKSNAGDLFTYVVNAKVLHDFIKAQKKSETVTFESDTIKSLNVSFGNSTICLECEDRMKFPLFIPEMRHFGCCITVKTENFLNAINHTEKSISKDETRGEYCGYMIEVDGNDLNVVTCDGHRLSIERCRIESNNDRLLKESMMDKFKDRVNKPNLVVVNAKLMSIVKMLSDACDVLNIYTRDDKLFINCDNFVVYQALECAYLNYESVLNIGNRRTAEFLLDKKDLVSALKSIEPAVNKRNKILRVKFNDDNLELFTSGLDNAQFEQKEMCKIDRSYRNTGSVIGINHRYFLESVSEMDSEIKITMINPDSPIFVNNLCNLRCTQVVMPCGI